MTTYVPYKPPTTFVSHFYQVVLNDVRVEVRVPVDATEDEVQFAALKTADDLFKKSGLLGEVLGVSYSWRGLRKYPEDASE